MTMEWGNDLIMEFIEAYKCEPVLWCQTNPHHKDRRWLNEAWDRLGKRLNIEVADLKRKKDSIMASFRGLMRRKKASLRTDHVYHPVWFAYETLEDFLHPELARFREPTESNGFTDVQEIEEVSTQEPDDSDHVEYLEDQNDEYISDVHIKQEPKHRRSKAPFNNAQRPRLTLKQPIKKRVFKTNRDTNNTSLTEIRILEALKSLKRSEPAKAKKDECDSFGEYIAESLRKHDERTQCMIKQAINNILFEQEMKKYSNQEQYVVISNVNVNVDENPLILGEHDEK